jgi:hypothetical protein
MTALYRIGHLERLPLKTPYPAQIERVRYIMRHLPRETNLVVDFTGVGRGIYDMLVDAGLSPIGVTIHSGFETHVPTAASSAFRNRRSCRRLWRGCMAASLLCTGS